jgi:hypothetical protein
LAIAQAGITMLSLFALSIPSAAFAERGDQGDDGEQVVSVQTHHDDDNDDGDEEDDNDDNDGPSANLIVKKVVVGGQLTASAFSFTYDKQGNEPGVTQQFNANGENDLTVAVGAYDITEVPVANYTPSYTSNQEGHANDCNNLSAGSDQSKSKHGPVICTITNTYHAPENQSCTLVSDATTNVGESPAVLSFVHGNWTHGLDASGAKWIWNAFHATPSADTDEVVTFTKTFNVVGTPSSVNLDLASDNTYTVAVNGTPSCSDTVNLDNFSSVEPTCDITSLVHTGVNTLTFVVTNTHGFGTNPETNPGGLIYKVSITGASCAAVPPPTENSCVLATAGEVAPHVTIANSGEDTVQTILTAKGYSLNADTDQKNYQVWQGSGNSVDFSVKVLKKLAGYSHVYGYYTAGNTGTFVPVFRDGTVPGYAAVPLHSEGDVVTFTVNPVSAAGIGFAVITYDGSVVSAAYATEKSLNVEGASRAVVYNPSSNVYVIGFDDQTGTRDNDYNDLMVEVTVTGCHDNNENPTTGTITAYKVICTDEKDLPNWGSGGPDITATTAQNWVATHESCHLAEWNFQWAPDGTANPGDNATGVPTGWNSFATGVATSIPANALAWVRENISTDYIPFVGASNQSNVSAEMYCSSDVLNYDNYDFINPVVAGTAYYCVGFNSPKVSTEITNTAETIVVKSADLETQAMPAAFLTPSGKWFFYNDTTDAVDNNLGTFVTGPAVAPIGTGSTDMVLAAANSRTNIATFAFSNVKLSDIKTLAFSSYSHSGVSGPSESPYLVFNVSFDGTGVYQSRLVYVPANNGAVPQDAWNTNDTIQSGAGQWVYSGATWPGGVIPGTTPKTWSQILSDYPNARVLPVGGLMGVRVGEPGPAGYEGNVDKFVIGIQTGSNIHTKTFDFEPTAVAPQTGTLKIVKHTVGGNGSFTFNVTGQSPVVVTTSANEGLSSNLVLAAGEYDVSEGAQSGWSFTSATCSDANQETTTQSDISNGKHITLLASHTVTCYFDNNKVAIDTPTTFTTTSTGGGRSGGRSSGGGGGRVLGASTTNTSCIPPITMYMKYGWKNDVSQVKALQSFLNDYMHTSLTVNGVFGKDTFAAVKAFQKQEGDKVLNPWVGLPASGIKSKDTPTGYVYQTTKWHINNIVCPGSEEFPAKLI